MSTNDRDTHFQGWASALYPDLARLFLAMYSFRVNGEEEKALAVAQEIKTLLAQCGHDLAYHILKTAEEHDLFADNFYGRFSLDTEAKLTKIPDFTEWPKPD